MVSTADLGGAGSVQTVLVGSGAFVDQHPELVARLLKAQQPAVTWLRNEANKQAYIDLVSRLAGYPSVIFASDAADQSFASGFDPRLDASFVSNLQRSADQALQAKLIRKAVDVKTWVEPRFLDAALQSTDNAPQASR